MHRLDRILANLGYGTRSEVAALIREGRVEIDGVLARAPAAKADPHTVTLDGAALEHPDGVLVALHKPLGTVCTHADGDGPTVYDLLPHRWAVRNPVVTSIGRLDKDTSGVLLLTDDHALVHRLTSPRHHVPKTYLVTVSEPPPDPLGIVETFVSGTLVVSGDDRPCIPAALTWVEPNRAEVVLTEGRYHQVRRMFAAAGLHVEALHRTAFGGVVLAGLDLPAGSWCDVALP